MADHLAPTPDGGLGGVEAKLIEPEALAYGKQIEAEVLKKLLSEDAVYMSADEWREWAENAAREIGEKVAIAQQEFFDRERKFEPTDGASIDENSSSELGANPTKMVP